MYHDDELPECTFPRHICVTQMFYKNLTGHLNPALCAFSYNSSLLRRRKQGANPSVRHIPSLSGFSIRRYYRGTPCRVGARGIVASLSILHIQYNSKRHHHSLYAPGSVRDFTPLKTLCVVPGLTPYTSRPTHSGFGPQFHYKSRQEAVPWVIV